MRERNSLERELADLDLCRLRSRSERQGKDDSGQFGLFPAGGMPLSWELEQVHSMRAAASGGGRSLGAIVEEHLRGLPAPAGGECVEASLRYFTEACRSQNVQKQTYQGHEIPRILTHAGRLLSARPFLLIWFSGVNANAAVWSRLPQACRGAGAPGALLYADLAEGRRLITSAGGWPQGLRPGAFMQLWPSRRAYEQVRDMRQRMFGHSCVFRRYRDGRTIEIADQNSLTTQFTWGHWGLTYIIAANPGNIDIVSEEAG